MTLQKRKRHGFIRDRSVNPTRIETGLPVEVLASILPTYPKQLAQDVALPEDVAWISSRLCLTRVKVFDEKYNLEDCEKEQQSPSWTLASSQICLLIYGESSRSLIVSDALQPLLAEDERLISGNFLFIIATPKLDEVNLEKALQVALHIAICLVRKDQVNLLKSQWTEDHRSGRHRTMQASLEIQPAPQFHCCDCNRDFVC
jgi:hypothetical protein